MTTTQPTALRDLNVGDIFGDNLRPVIGKVVAQSRFEGSQVIWYRELGTADTFTYFGALDAQVFVVQSICDDPLDDDGPADLGW